MTSIRCYLEQRARKNVLIFRVSLLYASPSSCSFAASVITVILRAARAPSSQKAPRFLERSLVRARLALGILFKSHLRAPPWALNRGYCVTSRHPTRCEAPRRRFRIAPGSLFEAGCNFSYLCRELLALPCFISILIMNRCICCMFLVKRFNSGQYRGNEITVDSIFRPTLGESGNATRPLVTWSQRDLAYRKGRSGQVKFFSEFRRRNFSVVDDELLPTVK